MWKGCFKGQNEVDNNKTSFCSMFVPISYFKRCSRPLFDPLLKWLLFSQYMYAKILYKMFKISTDRSLSNLYIRWRIRLYHSVRWSSVKYTLHMFAFDTIDIILMILNIIIIVLILMFHIQTNATDCRGQLVTKTKSSDGHICTRQAKLSIHEAGHASELEPINRA